MTPLPLLLLGEADVESAAPPALQLRRRPAESVTIRDNAHGEAAAARPQQSRTVVLFYRAARFALSARDEADRLSSAAGKESMARSYRRIAREQAWLALTLLSLLREERRSGNE